MFSFLKRKPALLLTFNERVAVFWKWFVTVAPRFYSSIETRNSASLAAETSAKVNEIMPGLGWVFGPGREGQGHSLTLTGEGNIHRQLLTLQWLAQAPAIPGWTFYAARQPDTIKGRTIEMLEISFDPKEIWVTPTINAESENFDLTIWHPAWVKLDESQKYSVVFLFLDEALGEYGTDRWIGEIKFGRDQLKGSFPLEEFADYVSRTARGKGWKATVPGETYTLFQTKSPDGNFPRADVLTQSTAVPKLFQEFMRSAGNIPDPLADSGADYVYVSIQRDFFPKGDEVDTRGKIADAIEDQLKPFSGGRCIGGAQGVERCYIDLLLFDGPRSLDAVQLALKAQNVPSGTMIEYFAREKSGRRIAL